jgi:membrane-associated phospholipid phosphatase
MSSKRSPMEKTGEALLDADAAVTDAVVPFSETAAVEALGTLSEIGDQPQARALCLLVLALGVARGEGRLAHAGARMLIAHEAATAAKDFIKHRVDRTRPRSLSEEQSHKPKPGRHTHKEVTSFPSGHSAGATALARAFSRDYPEYSARAYAGAGLVALAQIPRCAHYPTDVGSGVAVGVAAEAAASWLFDWASERLEPVFRPSTPARNEAPAP